MVFLPVLGLLVYDAIVFLGALPRLRSSPSRSESVALSALFFFSGMPALIYQIVWQRALFSIYGVNAESVAVIVSAFMLGLGLGSLLGGWVSERLPERAVALFGVSELSVALFGLASLHIFHWAAEFSAGANLPATVIFGILLLLFPTLLMGATLPLLVQHFVHDSSRVGFSVAMLYFVNTFGSAVACYLCATFVLAGLGESGSVVLAASMNSVVGLIALRYGGRRSLPRKHCPSFAPSTAMASSFQLSLRFGMLVAGFSGFVALGLEIVWFRIFAVASHDRAPAFALLLSTYLAGVAAGSYISEKVTERRTSENVMLIVGALLLGTAALSAYLPPLVALIQSSGLSFLIAAPAFFTTAALIGSVLPLVCRLAVSAGPKAGSQVSWTYASNIAGCTLGSILIGFFWMHHFGLRDVSVHLSALSFGIGIVVIIWYQGKPVLPPGWASVAALGAFLAFGGAPLCYSSFYEKLIFGPRGRSVHFAQVVENRNGVIAVTREGAVFGDGVYDGFFNVDPSHDLNLITRVYAVSLFHAEPKRVLMIGLSSGSWAQILANHPQIGSLDVVEINPGYLQLIPQYPCVSSLLVDPKVHIYIDDGRRWLLAHPRVHYDLIVMNTSFYWRDHTSALLSADFLQLVRRHLNPGGVFYYNTTGSEDVMSTGLRVFPYGLRILNFLAVSDSPFDFNTARWMSTLRQYRIDGRLVFDPGNPKSVETLVGYDALTKGLDKSTDFQSMETSASLRNRLTPNTIIITDDNMGDEWRVVPGVF
jgi:spermidine synthase